MSKKITNSQLEYQQILKQQEQERLEKERQEQLRRQEEERIRREREAAIRRQKYQNLYNNLNAVKQKLEDLQNFYPTMYNSINNSLLINNKIIEEDKLKQSTSNNGKILWELSYTIIPYTRNHF